ncbi:MAG: GlsB/YeaQ/YmgE family stress response membrane protein [Acidimicrobiales bacterium]
MSFWTTVAIGVVGSYLGGFIGWLIFDRDDVFSPGGLIGSIIGAVIVLLVYNAMGGRRTSRA